MHDLTNAAAHALARRLENRRGATVQTLTYPIERPCDGVGATALALNAAAAERKGAAILGYTPLADEYPRYRELATRDHEVLAADAPGFAWPAVLPEQPYYERFGKQRLRERRYNTLITYAAHVRPIAVQVLAGCSP
jgi:hypothetical protein